MWQHLYKSVNKKNDLYSAYQLLLCTWIIYILPHFSYYDGRILASIYQYFFPCEPAARYFYQNLSGYLQNIDRYSIITGRLFYILMRQVLPLKSIITDVAINSQMYLLDMVKRRNWETFLLNTVDNLLSITVQAFCRRCSYVNRE